MLSNDARLRRSARTHDHGSRRRRVIRIVVPVVRLILLAGLAAAVWHVVPGRLRETTRPRGEAGPSEATSRPIRAEYPLSLIPGGVTSDAEFETARDSDPVLAEHYSDVGFLHPVRFSQDQLLYASFRQKNSVVWTNSRILVHAGEAVFADRYGNLVRGRCGNRLSETPRTPAAFVDPPEVASEKPEIAFAPAPLPDGSGADYDIAPLTFGPVEPPPAHAAAGAGIVTTATLPEDWPPENMMDAATIFGFFGPPAPVRRPQQPRAGTVPEPGTSVLILSALIALMTGATALRRRSPGNRDTAQQMARLR